MFIAKNLMGEETKYYSEEEYNELYKEYNDNLTLLGTINNDREKVRLCLIEIEKIMNKACIQGCRCIDKTTVIKLIKKVSEN